MTTPTQTPAPVGHTPGPWKAERMSNMSPNSHTVWIGDRSLNGMPEPDARLIAAAPELLAALEWVSSEMAHTMKLMGADPACSAALVASGLALAKAKGAAKS